jgi:integrase
MAKGWRSDNPADVAQQVLPKHDRSKIERRRALPYNQVAGAIQRVKDSGASQATKLAFELLVHTASRSVEIREAVWSEFDTENAVWTIPASRMKAKKAHRIPLTARCLSMLESAKALRLEKCDFVFPSIRGTPLSDMTLSKLMNMAFVPALGIGRQRRLITREKSSNSRLRTSRRIRRRPRMPVRTCFKSGAK